jgi:hypothetical protein
MVLSSILLCLFENTSPDLVKRTMSHHISKERTFKAYAKMSLNCHLPVLPRFRVVWFRNHQCVSKGRLLGWHLLSLSHFPRPAELRKPSSCSCEGIHLILACSAYSKRMPGTKQHNCSLCSNTLLFSVLLFLGYFWCSRFGFVGK